MVFPSSCKLVRKIAAIRPEAMDLPGYRFHELRRRTDTDSTHVDNFFRAFLPLCYGSPITAGSDRNSAGCVRRGAKRRG